MFAVDVDPVRLVVLAKIKWEVEFHTYSVEFASLLSSVILALNILLSAATVEPFAGYIRVNVGPLSLRVLDVELLTFTVM